MACHPSYPLNSENASPPGTFTEYLSCAKTAKALITASPPVIIGIVNILLPFITAPPFCQSTARERSGLGVACPALATRSMPVTARSEEHTSELQSPYVISYAV